MKIIQLEANPSGSRPALQDWSGVTPPSGFVFCAQEHEAIFYSTTPAGFVNFEHDGTITTSMEVNQTALDEYVASLPEETEPEEVVSAEEQMRADIDYIAAISGIEL